jgi:hypothetical protein
MNLSASPENTVQSKKGNGTRDEAAEEGFGSNLSLRIALIKSP